MAKPITPDGHVDHWRKRWSTPRLLTADECDAALEEFIDVFVPGHMEKKFRQFFPTPRAKFGNRFFRDDAIFYPWTRTFSSLGLPDVVHMEATIIYAMPAGIEGHRFRGEPRRSLKDLFVDDWQPAAAMLQVGGIRLYLFIEPKMRGCIILRVEGEADEDR